MKSEELIESILLELHELGKKDNTEYSLDVVSKVIGKDVRYEATIMEGPNTLYDPPIYKLSLESFVSLEKVLSDMLDKLTEEKDNEEKDNMDTLWFHPDSERVVFNKPRENEFIARTDTISYDPIKYLRADKHENCLINQAKELDELDKEYKKLESDLNNIYKTAGFVDFRVCDSDTQMLIKQIRNYSKPKEDKPE